MTAMKHKSLSLDKKIEFRLPAPGDAGAVFKRLLAQVDIQRLEIGNQFLYYVLFYSIENAQEDQAASSCNLLNRCALPRLTQANLNSSLSKQELIQVDDRSPFAERRTGILESSLNQVTESG